MPAASLAVDRVPRWRRILHTYGVHEVSDTQGRREAEPVQDTAPMEDGTVPTGGRVVETDVTLTLFGVEHDGKLPLTDAEIEATVSGMPLYLRGHKFVLCVEPEGEPERFFFPEELSGESVAVSAYIDGRTLMVLARWAQASLDGKLGAKSGVGAREADYYELEAAVACVKATMEGVSVEVRGGG